MRRILGSLYGFSTPLRKIVLSDVGARQRVPNNSRLARVGGDYKERKGDGAEG